MTWMHPLPTDCRFPGYALSPPCKIRFTKQLLYVMIILSRISGEEYRQYTMKYEEYPTKHPAPESQTLGRKPLPSNVILGETAYSPGDHAVTLWPFYDPVFPVNVMAIGETKCRPDYHVIRPRSRIMAIEYIAQGAGILKINGQTYRPEQNCTILLTKHSAHSYEADAQNPWQKHWIVFDGPFMQNMIDSYLPKNSYCFTNCNLLPYFHEISRCVQAQKRDYPRLIESLTVILLQMVLQMNRVVMQREASLPEKIRSKGSCHWKRSARNSAIPKIILLRYSVMNMASLPTATLRRRKSRLPSSTYAIPVLQLTRSPSTSPMPTGIIFPTVSKSTRAMRRRNIGESMDFHRHNAQCDSS